MFKLTYKINHLEIRHPSTFTVYEIIYSNVSRTSLIYESFSLLGYF